MKYIPYLIALCLITLSCSSTQEVNYTQDTDKQLQFFLDDTFTDTKQDVTGVSLSVIAPFAEIDFSGAAGYDSIDKDALLKANQPFRIASVTKVFVAVAILRLYEQGEVLLEDAISKYISQEHIALLKEGGYDPDKITIRHCLGHTSGLYDYAEGGPEYIEAASKTPNKIWSRTEQIQFAIDNGSPYAAPGAENNYSDTGYILLGEIIERTTKLDLAAALRSLLKFDELGMTSTYLQSLEESTQELPQEVHRYVGSLDATKWHNSVDLYGGGGLVSTTRDLSVFLQAVFNNRVFENKNTLGTMLLLDGRYMEGNIPKQRLGFDSYYSKKLDVETYLHSGFWGTLFVYIPTFNASIAINNTQDGDVDGDVLTNVIYYLEWLDKKPSGKM